MPISFEEVMAFHPDNQYVYEEIRDNLGQLLPFVGAGLTAPVYKGWASVIEELGTHLANKDTRGELKRLLDLSKLPGADEDLLLDAAQLLEEKRGKLNLARDLVYHFSSKKLEDK